jgi:hypothetical protein
MVYCIEFSCQAYARSGGAHSSCELNEEPHGQRLRGTHRRDRDRRNGGVDRFRVAHCQVYGPALNGTVPECTGTPSATHPCRSEHSREAEEHAPRKSCAVRSRTARRTSNRYSLCGGPWCRQVENHMLLIVGAIFVLSAVVVIRRMRVPGGVNASTRGWMSDQWLAEHRAWHSR